MTTQGIPQAIERQVLLAECQKTIHKTFEYIKSHLSVDDLTAFEKNPDLIKVRDKYPELTDIVNELFDMRRNVLIASALQLPPMPQISNN